MLLKRGALAFRLGNSVRSDPLVVPGWVGFAISTKARKSPSTDLVIRLGFEPALARSFGCVRPDRLLARSPSVEVIHHPLSFRSVLQCHGLFIPVRWLGVSLPQVAEVSFRPLICSVGNRRCFLYLAGAGWQGGAVVSSPGLFPCFAHQGGSRVPLRVIYVL